MSQEQLRWPEKWFPLKVLVCEACWLVQTEDYVCAEELFDNHYAYFSSFSTSWLAHAERYVCGVVERFGLTASSFVLEVAANDGYLLQYVKGCGIPCLGIEPTASTASAARAKGVDVVEEFFGLSLARRLVEQGFSADLMVANNVLAHVPDINDFVAGFRALLKLNGVATFEFPHLLRLVQDTQFDTIYHEHYSYLSFTAAVRILEHAGLSVFDVEELPTHGGSLRVFAQRDDSAKWRLTSRVAEILKVEADRGVTTATFYAGLQASATSVKNTFLAFLLDAARAGKRVAAYGAAAKGNTLLNYAGVRGDLLSFVADRNPAKRGCYLPGSRIPIVEERQIRDIRPEYVVLLPWNLQKELTAQLDYVQEWGGRFVIAVPSLKIL